MPHHRHHRHHHPRGADKYSDGLLDPRRPPNTRCRDRNNSLNLGRLNRDPGAPNNHDAVESWLGGVVAHTSRPRPTPPGFREETIENPRRGLPRVARSRNDECAERVGPAWMPYQIIPMKTSHSPRQPHSGPEKRPRRSKHGRNDSSVISGFENTAKPSDCGLVLALHEGEQIAPDIPLAKEDQSVGDLSNASHLDELEPFERRPRRKTREDKYDTKKKGGRKPETTREGGQHSHRRNRIRGPEKKRKPAMPSKNVMDNFNSHAVMNDRITVQPTFKPGLFDNGRLSRGQPIPDLAFSEMQFLKHRKNEAHPKPLSKSRVRERRRENREIEQVSSFFLPSKMERKHRQQTMSALETHQNSTKASARYRQNSVTQNHAQSIHTVPSQNSLPPTINKSVSSTCDRVCRLPTHSSSELGRAPESSKATTYFTWSSSYRSSQSPRRHFETSSYRSDSAPNTTPEIVRNAIIATGVYQDTGIFPYDYSTNRKRIYTTDWESSTNGCDPSQLKSHNQDEREPSAPPAADSRANATVTNDSLKDLKQRWESILPPEWRLERDITSRHSIVADSCHTQNTVGEKGPESPQNPGFVDCQNMARIDPDGTNIRDCDTTPTSRLIDPISNPNSKITDSASLKLRQGKCDQVPESQDRVSQTSREAMPPPPLPIGKNSGTGPNTDSNVQLGSNSTANGSQDTTCISSGNVLAQHNLDPNGGRNTPASSIDTSMSKEITNTSLEPMSWIPLARPPSTINDNWCRALSRASMRTPIYASQLNEESKTDLSSTLPPRPQPTESICEFIARIERETEERISPEDDVLVDQEIGLDTATLESPIAHVETYRRSISPPTESLEEFTQQPTVLQYAEQEYEGLNSNQIFTDNGKTKDLMMDGRDTELLDSPQPTMRPFEGIQNERLEMSRFWRPNYFSQY